MYNAIIGIDQSFPVKNSGLSCLALIFNLSNLRMTNLLAKKSVQGCNMRRVMYCFFWVGRYELMWLRRIVVSRATSIPFQHIAKTPNSP